MNARPNLPYKASSVGKGPLVFSDFRLPVTAVSFRRCAFEPVQSISDRPQSLAEASLMRS